MPSTLAEHWFVFQNDRLLLIKNNNTYHLPTGDSLSTLKSYFLRQHKLGEYNQILCYCSEIDQGAPLPVEFSFMSLRKAFDLLGLLWYVPAVKAYSVINWDKNHQFCGRCGAQTAHKQGTFERLCEQCGLAQYPRISPSMIVLIKKGEQLLMARNPHFPPGAYGLIAGFAEVGESIEDAVHREVKEEVGLTIKNLQYYASQSWPFPDSLMFGFIADYDSGELVIDKNELETAGWYRYDNLPGRPATSLSLAGKLIDHFIDTCERQKQKG